MKLRFNRHEMAEALSAVCSVAAARTPKETLRCVHIEAQPDVVILAATDLELGLRCAVSQVEVEEPGETLVVAETLARIVRECTDEVLDMQDAASALHLRGAGSHFQIVTHDATEFPPVPKAKGEPDMTIGHGMLRRQIEWTVFASARESTRYAINGVLWEVANGKLTLAATDGRRLSVAQSEIEEPKSGERTAQAIVPGKALSLFGRLSAEDDARVAVTLTANQLILDLGRATISTSLVEGHFPKYQDVSPSDCDRVVELGTAEFLSALKRAALLTNEESKGVRFAFSEGMLTLSSRAPEQGEAEISMPSTYQGESLEIGFNPVFLLDVLRVVPTEQVSFALKEANRPGVISVGDGFKYVVMPVNLASG